MSSGRAKRLTRGCEVSLVLKIQFTVYVLRQPCVAPLPDPFYCQCIFFKLEVQVECSRVINGSGAKPAQCGLEFWDNWSHAEKPNRHFTHHHHKEASCFLFFNYLTDITYNRRILLENIPGWNEGEKWRDDDHLIPKVTSISVLNSTTLSNFLSWANGREAILHFTTNNDVEEDREQIKRKKIVDSESWKRERKEDRREQANIFFNLIASKTI